MMNEVLHTEPEHTHKNYSSKLITILPCDNYSESEPEANLDIEKEEQEGLGKNELMAVALN